MAKYYHVTVGIKPYMCSEYIVQTVISEHPLDFDARNQNKRTYDTFSMRNYLEISLDKYLKYRPKNARKSPKKSGDNQSIWYVDRDYGEADHY